MDTEQNPGPPPPTEFRSLVERTVGLQPWRRVFHATSGILIVFVPAVAGWSRGATLALLTVALFAGLVVDLVRLRSRLANRVFFRVFSSLASPREATGIASSTWYTLGAIVAFALYPPTIAAASILLLALADPAAAVVGRLVGRRPVGKGTVEGTAAFWIVGSGVLGAFVAWPHALLAAGATAVAEILPGVVDDNLVIPVVAGAVLWFSGAPLTMTGFPF